MKPTHSEWYKKRRAENWENKEDQLYAVSVIFFTILGVIYILNEWYG